MTLAELLGKFTSQELADVLSSLGLTVAGSKEERIRRLVSQGGPATEILDAFRSEDLRWLCGEVGVRTARKAEMIEKLAELLDGTIPEAKPAPIIQPPSKEGVVSVLQELRVPKRKAREEYHAQDEIASELQRCFGDVAFEYNIGGHFGLKIDIDIGNGKVGVEVKLAEALFQAQQAHRLIGQAVYYQKMRYGDNLVIAIVGDGDDLQEPIVRELSSILGDLGIATVSIRTI